MMSGQPAGLRLRTKILLLALLNVALLAGAFALFVRSQLDDDLGSFLLAALRERLLTTGRNLATELGDADLTSWDGILQRRSAEYGVTLVIFRAGTGQRLAGPALELPAPVSTRLQLGPNRQGGPRRNEALARGERRRLSPFLRGGFLLVTEGPYQYWIGTRILIDGPPHANPTPATLLLASTGFWTNPFFFPLEQWIAAAGIALVLSACCWLPFVGGVTRSIEAMRKATGQIAEGNFQNSAEATRSDEIGQLGIAINRMAAQLEAQASTQKRFLASVAHELRSPIARMQVALSLAERAIDPARHQRLADCQEELEQMTRLTDELITFAKAEMRPETIQLRPVPLAELIQRVLHAERTGDVPVAVHIDSSLQVQGEPEYLHRAFANLVRNANRYAGSSGPISISASPQGRQVRITVADCGPGVPAEALPQLFSPFFRVDASRDRRSGGAGLGLAIARSCIEACAGSIAVRNRAPQGLEVIVTLTAL